MSRLLLFTALAVTAFSSCSVSRSGQTKTPDDVYYSPARDGAAYVETEKKRDGYRNDEYYSNSSDDQWLRMRVRDRYRWSAFDDYDWNDYRYSSWNMGGYGYNGYNPYYYNNFNSYFNSYYAWNSYYNPYCPGIIVVNPKGNVPVYTAVRNFNLSRYTNNSYNNSNRPLSNSKIGNLRYGAPSYNNSNTRTGTSLGSSIRKVFSNDNGNSGRNTYYTPGSNDRPTRTYTPDNSSSTRSYTPSSSSSSSSSSGSSGGSSGGGGGVSRPSRGGN
jgi:hypothetical protein